MYEPPQTFFYDESPPASPIGTRGPAVQIVESPRPSEMQHSPKMEHRRWKSIPQDKFTAQPYSYEYTLDNGRLGITELKPERDFLHYSSSRETSQTRSRNASTRTSRESAGRPSLDVRSSISSRASDISSGPPPSPRQNESVRRGLSLRGMRGRRSAEETRTSPRLPPSPFLKPDIEKLAASFGPNGPQHITSPIQTQTLVAAEHAFEAPRPAPRPPLRHPQPRPVQEPASVPREEQLQGNESSSEVKANASAPRSRLPLQENASKQNAKSATVDASDQLPVMGHGGTRREKTVKFAVQEEVDSPRVPLRRKTSKFFEHVEDAPKPKAAPVREKRRESPPPRQRRKEEIPPVPPMPASLPPFAFQLPPQPPSVAVTTSTSMAKAPVVRSNTVRHTKPVLEESGPWQQNIARKRSASNMKSLPPAPGPLPKRSMSTRSRPPPQMADFCMAQVKPVLTSPVVAAGHARMISC